MKADTRDRLVLPILLPIAILAGVGLALWGFSRILLGIHGTAATVVALIVAASIVVMAAVAAARPQVRGSTIVAMLGATAGIAMLAGGVAIAVTGEGEGGHGPGGEGATVQLTAANLAFDPTSLSVPAGAPFTIEFANQDAGVQHNVEIFDTQDFSGRPLFDGQISTGPAQLSYQVEPLESGTYYFRCVVHPATMTGTLEAAGGGGGGPGGPGGGGLTVVAQGIAFDTTEIDLVANAPTTITFDNEDAGVQHNIAIYTDDTLAESLFRGDLVTGPATADYAVPPLPAGDYYFHCDVHPNMSGSVVVSEGGGPPVTGPVATGASGGTGLSGQTGPPP